MNNTFINTLLNPKRNIPFWLWWWHGWLVAWAGLISNLVSVLTLRLVIPNWEYRMLARAVTMELEYQKYNERYHQEK